jgi:hypothetical protein
LGVFPLLGIEAVEIGVGEEDFGHTVEIGVIVLLPGILSRFSSALARR